MATRAAKTSPVQPEKAQAALREAMKGSSRSSFSFDDYDNVIGFVVSQAGYRLAHALEDVIASVGSDVRPREFAILNRLHQHGELTQVQLAELTYKDRPAITRMLDRLIARRLVKKVVNPTDRRAFMVSLTPRGMAIRDAIVPLMAGRLQSACADIPQEHLEITVAALRQISAQI
jgi:DNA-binding MarR family transcriptional regulator